MKKILCLCLAVAMMLSVASCGKKQATVKDGEVPTLSWYLPGDAQKDLPAVVAEANKIIEKEIGAKIDIKFIDQGSYDERMKMNMASQTDMDLVFTGFVLKPQNAIELGGLYDITDLLPKVTPKLYNELIPDYVWKAATYKGKIYSVPNMQILCQVSAFAIDSDLAKKYNFDYNKVKKPADLVPFLQAVKDNEPNRIPTRSYITPTEVKDNYEGNYQHICAFDKKTFKFYPEYALPGELDRLAEAHDWYKKGYLRKDITTVQDDTADYLSGKYAVIGTTWKPGNDAELYSSTGIKYVTVRNVKPYLLTSSAIATQIGVSATTKYPELCLKFIELMNSNKELYNLISFGIEGKHYNLNENGRVEFVENSGYAPKASWKFGNQFNALLLPEQDADVWEQTKKANDESEKSALLGFLFDPNNVKQEITQCTNIKQQYGVPVDADDYEARFNTLCQKMKEAGVDKVIADYQKQLDDYLAENKIKK